MPILNIMTTPVEGLVGVNPQIIYIDTSDTVAIVTTAGYLNSSIAQGFTYNTKQMALIYTTDAGPDWYEISISAAGVITLVASVNPGNVLLPVAVNRIASFTNVAGQIGDVTAAISHRGNIVAGVNNLAAGSFVAIPAGNNQGTLIVTPIANAGGFNTIISNTAIGQSSTYSLPDPGGAATSFLITNSAGTQTIATGSLALTLGSLTVSAGNIAATLGTITAGTTMTAGTGITSTTGNITATAGAFVSGSAAGGTVGTLRLFSSATAGSTLVWIAPNNAGATATTFTTVAFGQATGVSMADPVNANARLLIAATATPFTSGNLIKSSGTGGLTVDGGFAVIANTTAAYAGGGTSNAFAAAGLTATSIVTAVILTSTNSVAITKAVPTANVLTITFSADPGAATTVSYIATSVAV